MSLTLRPKSLASWSLWETDIISWLGSLPIYHAGKILLVIKLLLERGGKKTISLFSSPSATFCNLSHSSSMCLPILKSVTSVGAVFLTKVRRSSLDLALIYSSRQPSSALYSAGLACCSNSIVLSIISLVLQLVTICDMLISLSGIVSVSVPC